MGDFVKLGKDVVAYFFIFLDVKDIVSLSSTCRLMHQVSKRPHVWRQLVARDFGLTDLGGEDPFTVYTEEHGFALRHGWKNYKEYTCLIIGASKGRIGDVKAALRRGYPPNLTDDLALYCSLRYGHLEIAKLLLQDSRVNPAAKNNYPLLRSAECGYTDIVQILLQDPRVDPSARDSAALGYAVLNGHEEIVKLLLQDGRVDPQTIESERVLHMLEHGSLKMLELLRAHKKVKL